MNKKEAVIEILKTWGNESLINAWNERCRDKYPDDVIMCNDDGTINELFDNPCDAIRAVYYGHYRCTDNYFVFNGYGNLDSFDFVEDDECPFDFDELAEYLIEYGDVSTSEVDTDALKAYFIENIILLHDDYTKENINKIIDEYEEEEGSFDFLTEDWNDLLSVVEKKYVAE